MPICVDSLRYLLTPSFSSQFQSIMTLSMDKILRAFPDVPWAFVYREPVQVMQSHFNQQSGLRGESQDTPLPYIPLRSSCC